MKHNQIDPRTGTLSTLGKRKPITSNRVVNQPSNNRKKHLLVLRTEEERTRPERLEMLEGELMALGLSGEMQSAPEMYEIHESGILSHQTNIPTTTTVDTIPVTQTVEDIPIVEVEESVVTEMLLAEEQQAASLEQATQEDKVLNDKYVREDDLSTVVEQPKINKKSKRGRRKKA